MKPEIRRARFAAPAQAHRPMYYFTLPSLDDSDFAASICVALDTCRRSGCGTALPQLPLGTEIDASGLERVREMYALLLREAKARDLTVGFYLDPALEHAVIHAMGEIGEHALRARILTCHEYLCERGKAVKRRLHDGTLLSLVAYSADTGEVIDLRSFVHEGEVCWEGANGNFVLREYLSVEDTEREGANYLSYEASRGYIEAVFSLFADIFAPYMGSTLTVLSYSGIGFNGRNRRSWDDAFNAKFEERFGFDPAPYYPALFDYIGPKTEHVKALFMTVRAALIENGILRALSDFATEQGLTPFGSLSEPKLTACSFSIGDVLRNNRYAPCALFDKAYMYGTNSVKIAAGAAYNFDVERVGAELFRNYSRHDRTRLYKDLMNAFARGANCTALHPEGEITEDSTLGDFAARVQAMLCGGRHMADIAMLYPIYHLHSKVNLYVSPANGYEYPTTPYTADYMTLINSISIYAGHDLTLLHPDTLNERCRTDGGVLYLDNTRNREQFRIVVLPATDTVSLANLRLLKKFFDEGGKILATGVLPTAAFEYDEDGANDREVRALTEAIFGRDACDPRVMRDYCHNKNDAGGEAIFLYFNASATDGTHMTRSSTVNEALNSFELPFDIYLPGMPRLECTGALNSIFPEFHTIGLHRTMPGGGMLNHIHKRDDSSDTDIYYFSNTTDTDYNHHVLLRGAFSVEEWNPHTGEMQARKSKFLSYKGEIYTTLRLTLPSCTSTFFLATPAKADEGAVEEIASIHLLRSEHAALMSEF
ncbi:MAG: hypothetical protein IJA78_04030 [Clostridia bacterium]|nr:hypothetical protein [Clostridia bacterium]